MLKKLRQKINGYRIYRFTHNDSYYIVNDMVFNTLDESIAYARSLKRGREK